MWASWVMVCSEWGKVGGLEHSSEGGRRGRERERKNALDCPPCLAHALKKQKASLESEAKVCRRYVHVANAEAHVNREIIGRFGAVIW
jgi:hypothetical protein